LRGRAERRQAGDADRIRADRIELDASPSRDEHGAGVAASAPEAPPDRAADAHGRRVEQRRTVFGGVTGGQRVE